MNSGRSVPAIAAGIANAAKATTPALAPSILFEHHFTVAPPVVTGHISHKAFELLLNPASNFEDNQNKQSV
jgi:hypothetical protein